MESMPGMTTTATSSAAMTSSTMSMDHDMGGMDMGGSSADQCVISMLWNWNTVNSCFIARSWHITSRGMFAGSCIGVICLVMSLEFLRRLGREYDAFILRRAYLRALFLSPDSHTEASSSTPSDDETQAQKADVAATAIAAVTAAPNSRSADLSQNTFRPSLVEQLVRAALHMVQFAVAYFVMLLAMYFNGYIIICIFIGAFLGSFIFSWEPLGSTIFPENDAMAVTKCCG